MKVLIALVVALWTGTAAADALRRGHGVVCDAPEQVERFAMTTPARGTAEELDAALTAVNAWAGNARACAFMAIEFAVVREVRQVTAPRGRVAIVEVSVVAVHTPTARVQLSAPATQYIFSAVSGHDI